MILVCVEFDTANVNRRALTLLSSDMSNTGCKTSAVSVDHGCDY